MLFKVKCNGSQYCCAISYLHWIVISIACCTRLEVFQCPERNNVRKIEEKGKQNHQIWIDFKPVLGICKGAPAPNNPAGEAYSNPQTPQLNLVCFTCVRLTMLASTDPQIIFLYYPLNMSTVLKIFFSNSAPKEFNYRDLT